MPIVKNEISLDSFKSRTLSKSIDALMQVGHFVKDESNALAPVDTGMLRNSAYVEMEDDRTVQVGYTAEYAAAVHEMTTQKLKGKPRADFGVTREGVGFGGGTGRGTYWETGEPKFLEKAIKKTSEINRIFQKVLKV